MDMWVGMPSDASFPHFLLNPIHDGNGIPDLVLISADGIHFHVHYWKLSQESYNSFGALLPIEYTPDAGNTTWRRLFEPAAVLRIVLCAIYGRFGNNNDIPLLHDIFSALEALEKYGFQPHAFTLPRSPLQSYLLSYTSHPDNAIQIYAIAASYDLKDIAVTTSAYLLNYPLTNINDVLADYMGSFYMLRLAQLQEDRISKLRELIFKEPSLHGPQPSCGFENQKRVTIGWARAVADLGWRISPGLLVTTIQQVLGAIHNDLTCVLCKAQLDMRIQDVVRQWSIADRTI